MDNLNNKEDCARMASKVMIEGSNGEMELCRPSIPALAMASNPPSIAPMATLPNLDGSSSPLMPVILSNVEAKWHSSISGLAVVKPAKKDRGFLSHILVIVATISGVSERAWRVSGKLVSLVSIEDILRTASLTKWGGYEVRFSTNSANRNFIQSARPFVQIEINTLGSTLGSESSNELKTSIAEMAAVMLFTSVGAGIIRRLAGMVVLLRYWVMRAIVPSGMTCSWTMVSLIVLSLCRMDDSEDMGVVVEELVDGSDRAGPL
jgi:hypothetical protein